MSEDLSNKTKLSIGEERIRTSFNVSGNSDVDIVKKEAASALNFLETHRKDENDFPFPQEKQRLISLAQTAQEEYAMWAVKALTYNS